VWFCRYAIHRKERANPCRAAFVPIPISHVGLSHKRGVFHRDQSRTLIGMAADFHLALSVADENAS
jgi:hypothetical protein